MSGIQLTEQQRFDWLRLIRTESVGPRTFRSLMSRFGGAGAALAGLSDLARAAGRRITLPPPGDIEREIEQARNLGVRFVALGEAGYPVPLAACQTAPPLLAVRGQLAALARPMVALVGSRNASGLGLKFTEKHSRELGEAGFVVVSGQSLGVVVVEAARKSGSTVKGSSDTAQPVAISSSTSGLFCGG
jgi:DNA processing protein